MKLTHDPELQTAELIVTQDEERALLVEWNKQVVATAEDGHATANAVVASIAQGYRDKPDMPLVWDLIAYVAVCRQRQQGARELTTSVVMKALAAAAGWLKAGAPVVEGKALPKVH